MAEDSGDDNVLTLGPVVLECPNCQNEYEETFQAVGQTVQDLQVPPEKVSRCPWCDVSWVATYTGFLQYGYSERTE